MKSSCMAQCSTLATSLIGGSSHTSSTICWAVSSRLPLSVVGVLLTSASPHSFNARLATCALVTKRTKFSTWLNEFVTSHVTPRWPKSFFSWIRVPRSVKLATQKSWFIMSCIDIQSLTIWNSDNCKGNKIEQIFQKPILTPLSALHRG